MRSTASTSAMTKTITVALCVLCAINFLSEDVTAFHATNQHFLPQPIASKVHGRNQSRQQQQYQSHHEKHVDDPLHVPTRLHTSSDIDADSIITNATMTETPTESGTTTKADASSTKEMLRFALPALGIFLANPLLSNIDNAFIGKTVGTQGLAAMSPATVCTDQMLYLFSFLGRATTGLVSGAFGTNRDTDAAREAAAAPLTVSLICGVFLSIFYAVGTPLLLSGLNVNQALRPAAASYVHWRGAISWAALGQASALSAIMSTRDAITPLKIVALAAAINIVGDAALCVWPLRMGCAGAAAATSFATVVSTAFMCRALHKKKMLPKLKLPSKKEWAALLEYTGPLMAITVARLLGTIAMQKKAMALGVPETAALQVSINLVFFFFLFGEPISQLSQTTLPALLADSKKSRDVGPAVRQNLKSILKFGAVTSVVVGATAGLILNFGAGAFTSDAVVRTLAQAASPSVFVAVATCIFAIAVDGAMLASRDFGFMLAVAMSSLVVQMYLLKNWVTNLSGIYYTFALRIGAYTLLSLLRIFSGRGVLGQFYRKEKTKAA